MVSSSLRFLDYQAHEEIKSQSRRDFREGSGNKLMLEAEKYLRQATDYFTIAGNNLSEAEDELYKVLEKFKKFDQIIQQLPALTPAIVLSPQPL